MTRQRWGITVPFAGVPLHAHREWFVELEDLGFTDVWSAEVNAHDAFTPLALAAAWAPSLRLGQAIVPVYTRGPALLAQSIASLAEAAPGRVVLGIGTSSNVIVERWNGIPFEKPYQRVRDTLRFLRAALAGEKVTEDYETFSVKGFRLGIRLAEPPPILLAALRPGMLGLAGREADGAIINWLSPTDVRTVVPHVGEEKEIAARIFVLPDTDRDTVLGIGRRMIAEYLNVPVYAAFHDWLGRGEALGRMWEAWKAGDRAGAVEAIPDAVVDDLVVHGSPEACAQRVLEYVENGVTTPAPMVIADPDTTRMVLRAMSAARP
ncbi:MAG: LLM class F420-dependent oxidoreductase [Actinobacteria bacterium]|nr:LLM class F420-dependent oxidoreductase [Actinomycetota bacterium]